MLRSETRSSVDYLYIITIVSLVVCIRAINRKQKKPTGEVQPLYIANIAGQKVTTT